MNTININDYILTDETNANKGSIWLHKLPNDETLFDVIDKLRKVHKEETLVFTEEINIIRKIIDKEVNFSNCIFQEDVNFSGCIFGEKDKEKDKEKVGATSLKDKVDFKDCVFTKEADFSETIFEQDTNFSRSIFCVVSFQDTVFSKNVRFHETIFHNNVDFFNTSFKGLVDFYLVKFEDNQQFHTTDFLDRAIFSNTTFKGETQFIYNKVDKNSYINFESAKFEKSLDISRANFNCNLNFWNISIQDKNISKFTRYKDDFSKHRKEGTVPSVYKQIRETYRIIKDNFYKQNNKVEGLCFYEKEMNVYLEEKREETNKKSPPKNRKTFIEKFREEPILNVGQLLVFISTILWAISKCLIFYIASVIFTSLIILEIVIKNKRSLKYRNPIKQNYYMPIILLGTAIVLLYVYIYNVENFWYLIGVYIIILFSMLLLYFPIEKDKIILWLNKNSNEFDTNWVVGVNFSLLVGILSYLVVLVAMNDDIELDTSYRGISNFITSLVDVFNLTKWVNLEIIGIRLKGFPYLLLFIGRIFIGYGYYQTIQAFRKFGKS